MPTVLDLGKLVKAKYPGQYDDLSDYEVGQKVKAKFPTQYADFTDAPEAQKPKQDGVVKSLAKGLASPFLKLGATAQALSTSKALGGKGADMRPHNVPYFGPTKPISTAKEAAGVGAELAGYAVGNPVASGAFFGAGAALEENKKAKDVVKQAAVGAATGAVLQGGSKAASKLKKLTTEILPESLMNHAVKPTLDELRKNIKYGDATLGKQLVQEGVRGSSTGLLKLADTQLTKAENELQQVLTNSQGAVNRADLEKYLLPAMKKLEKTPGAIKDAKVFQEILSDVPEQMSVAEANQIKRNLYDRLRDVAYKIDPSLSTTKEAMKTLGRGLKVEIENKSGQPETVRLLNQKLSIYGRLEDRVVDQLARANRNQLVHLSDVVLGSVGFSHPLAFAALIAKHGAQSTRVLSTAAVGLSKLNKPGTGPVSKTAGAAVKKVITNAPASLSRGPKQ
jgi:hypothetical protein